MTSLNALAISEEYMIALSPLKIFLKKFLDWVTYTYHQI